MRKEDELFLSPTKGELSLSRVVREIKDFMRVQPDKDYLVVIGSDSQSKHVNGHEEIDFVTAIIAHRVGYGAIYFLRKEKRNRIPTLREKITTETLMSLDIALEMFPLLVAEHLPVSYGFEIHIDVGQNGPTREFIREAVGIVTGNGFEAKTKPDSWGASTVADKHT